jgi:hypothetical protein
MITSLIRAILWGLINILFWTVIAILFSLMICTLFIGYTLEKIGNFIDWVFENDEKKSNS